MISGLEFQSFVLNRSIRTDLCHSWTIGSIIDMHTAIGVSAGEWCRMMYNTINHWWPIIYICDSGYTKQPIMLGLVIIVMIGIY